MKTLKIIFVATTLWLAGCSTTRPYDLGVPQARAYCPNGTVMICATDSLRGCRCGELIVLN
ncbi:MAG: hypothetical protein OEV41_03735 [Gammaproteobacteria bacterium]|nr:hypothetical protein [Gammaproteobacteria bacterium]MDH5344154.1 hypothetical protein [Gammaproteobacteria bacterium]